MIEKGCSIHEKNKKGESSVLLALQMFGRFDTRVECTVKLLIESGCSIAEKDRNGESCFVYAVRLGYLEIVKLMIAKGYPIDEKDRNSTKKHE